MLTGNNSLRYVAAAAAGVGLAAFVFRKQLCTLIGFKEQLRSLAVEREVAVRAVRSACKLTRAVQSKIVANGQHLLKADKSPVTVGDLGAQFLVTEEVERAFPHDPIVAEESSEQIDSQPTLLQELQGLIATVTGCTPSDSIIRRILNRGQFEGGRNRFWTIDPIDGTCGFLRGAAGQYAVALGLVIDGECELGVLGCPNLPFKSGSGQSLGVVFVASRGEKTQALSLDDQNSEEIVVHTSNTSNAKDGIVAESLESSHSSHEYSAAIMKILNISHPPIQCDSMVKYGMVSRGDASIYLRLPVPSLHYTEHIWDHAVGSRLVESAGGQVTDIFGKRLNFGVGRDLSENTGVVATANSTIHKQVLDAIAKSGLLHAL